MGGGVGKRAEGFIESLVKGGNTGLSRWLLMVTDFLESFPLQDTHCCLLLPLCSELRLWAQEWEGEAELNSGS